MDSKALVAVAISVDLIAGSMFLQETLFPRKPMTTAQASYEQPGQAADERGDAAQAERIAHGSPPATGTAPATQGVTNAGSGVVVATSESAPSAVQSQMIVRETDLYLLTFSREGATLSSVRLKRYKNADGTAVEMLLPKTETTGELPFALSFGDYRSAQVDVPFDLRESGDRDQSIYDFSRTFLSPTGIPFTLHKTYVFHRDEYLFELQIVIENSVNDFPALTAGGYAYTLTVGPQIGPPYAKLDGRNDYRNYAYYADGKRQDPKVAMGQLKELDTKVTWAGIAGKYFTAIAIPDATAYRLVFDSRKLVEGFDRSSISFERPALKSARTTDTFRFYLGPMKKEILADYDSPSKNNFALSGLHLDEVVTTSIFIGWLATLMKYLLDFFYLLVPNYGVAIILVTVLIKAAFLPLTLKSSESMSRMAALNPAIAEIRARLKDKPEKMSQEIAKLYKREKINPLSGILPLLLQIPIFFAFYNLLNSHFELRGALFIPGWITDLSAPEAVWSFPFTLPLLGWTELRALPLLMVLSQVLSSKLTQPTGGTQIGGSQARLLMYVLPIVFLFMLYDMPSGLVVYWTVQNILSFFQQLYVNHLTTRKKGAAISPTDHARQRSSHR
ncbi:MAG: membrane protein insertase YidC [Spirochaetia bacterium]